MKHAALTTTQEVLRIQIFTLPLQGSYKVKIESMTDDDQLLICLNVEFKVKWSLWA